ncbi:MAG: hypothetical protein NEHIOOID_00458 [Holosporales bacterium]
MKKDTQSLPEIKLVGITARTSNLAEMNPLTAKIGLTMQKFFMQGMQSRIANRKSPGKVFATYTQYESNEHGEYTYFLGEEVSSFNDVGNEFETLTIPAQNYVKFTSNPGQMPAVVIDMWQNIWKMKPCDLGAERAYLADFEIYDERCQDLSQAVLDIFIGVKD